jgi:ribosome-associated heat shock protein Hsp15
MDSPESPLTSVRIDVWLDVACLFKTRSEAQKACRGGKVEVNGITAKPHREVRPGDRIAIGRGSGRVQQVVVRGLAEDHLLKARARELYEDVTPAPSAEDLEWRRLLRAGGPTAPATAPGKKDRRLLRRLKGRD